MSRTCELTATSVRYGHNVSHSERKTSRTFRPNLHEKRLFSDSLKIFVRMRITPNALKTVELKGGLDNYLLQAKDSLLSKKAVEIKKVLMSKQAQ